MTHRDLVDVFFAYASPCPFCTIVFQAWQCLSQALRPGPEKLSSEDDSRVALGFVICSWRGSCDSMFTTNTWGLGEVVASPRLTNFARQSGNMAGVHFLGGIPEIVALSFWFPCKKPRRESTKRRQTHIWYNAFSLKPGVRKWTPPKSPLSWNDRPTRNVSHATSVSGARAHGLWTRALGARLLRPDRDRARAPPEATRKIRASAKQRFSVSQLRFCESSLSEAEEKTFSRSRSNPGK